MKNTLSLSPLSLAVFGLLASLSAAAVAQSAPALDTIVVSGSRSDTQLSETPVSIGSVKRAQWDADKAKSVGEIINSIPGVFWNDLGNEQHSMGIRQPISTNAVYQYLEDGIPIRPLGVFNHNALNETNMNGSSGVEVVKGAASSLYGSNAVGGAVNFITQKPSRTPTGYVGIRRDNTDGFTRIDSGASNTYGDLGLRFSHYSSKRDTNNWQQYSGGQKDSFTLRGDYDLGGSSWLKASLVHTHLDSDTQGNLSESEFLTERGKNINTFTYRKDTATRANLAWEGETMRNGVTTVTLFARDNDHGQLPSYTISSCPSTGNGSCNGTENNNAVSSVGLDVKHVQKLDWLRARWVSGFYIDRSQNDYWSNNLSVRQVNGINVSYVPHPTRRTGERNYQTDIANDALFSQFEFNPVADVRLVAGARYDSIRYDFTNHLTPGANFGAPNEVRSFSRLSPKVGATWALSAQQSVYANWSKGFTPPEVSQLYGKSEIPDLKPSVYDNKEVGWRAQWLNKLQLDSALYQLDGSDTIVSYTTATNVSENRNAGKTRSRGLELALSQKLGTLDWRVGGTWAEHEYRVYKVSSSVDYSGKTISAAPRLLLNAQVGWQWASTSRVALGLVRVGSYWMDDANTARYAGHTLLNLTGSHQLGQGWEAWGQVRNLTDKLYADTASRSGTSDRYRAGSPRSIMVGLTKTFGAR